MLLVIQYLNCTKFALRIIFCMGCFIRQLAFQSPFMHLLNPGTVFLFVCLPKSETDNMATSFSINWAKILREDSLPLASLELP